MLRGYFAGDDFSYVASFRRPAPSLGLERLEHRCGRHLDRRHRDDEVQLWGIFRMPRSVPRCLSLARAADPGRMAHRRRGRPRSSASRSRMSLESSSLNIAVSIRSTVPASLDPPPRPAPAGIVFSRSMITCAAIPNSSRNERAARAARLAFASPSSGMLHLKVMRESDAGRTSSVIRSLMETGRKIESNS